MEWLNADFMIGRRLLPHEYPADVASVVDLTCELPATWPLAKPVTYLNFPILDAGCPEATDLLSKIRSIRALPRPVYVHCAQGYGRTGVVAAALLLAEGHAQSVQDALVQISAARPGVRINGRQRRGLEEFAQRMAIWYP